MLKAHRKIGILFSKVIGYSKPRSPSRSMFFLEVWFFSNLPSPSKSWSRAFKHLIGFNQIYFIISIIIGISKFIHYENINKSFLSRFLLQIRGKLGVREWGSEGGRKCEIYYEDNENLSSKTASTLSIRFSWQDASNLDSVERVGWFLPKLFTNK